MSKLPFFLFSSLLASTSALAQTASLNCDGHIPCSELGYSQKSVEGCKSYLLCPFDKTYKICIPDCGDSGDTPTPGATCEQGGYLSAADSTKVCTSVKYAEKDCFDCKCPTKSADCKIGDIFYSDGKCSAEYASCMGSPIGVVYMLTDTKGNLVNTQTAQHGRIISLHDLVTTYGGFTPTWGFHMDLINALDASMKEKENGIFRQSGKWLT